MASFPSFLWLSNIPLSIHTILLLVMWFLPTVINLYAVEAHLTLCLVRLIPICLGSLLLPPRELPVFPIKTRKCLSPPTISPPAPRMPPGSPRPPLLLALAASRLSCLGSQGPVEVFSFSCLSPSPRCCQAPPPYHSVMELRKSRYSVVSP